MEPSRNDRQKQTDGYANDGNRAVWNLHVRTPIGKTFTFLGLGYINALILLLDHPKVSWPFILRITQAFFFKQTQCMSVDNNYLLL